MKNRFTLFLISISLIGILLAPACKKKKNDPDPPSDSTFVQKVDKILEDYIAGDLAEGIVMYTRNTNGDLYWDGVGLADVEGNIPMNKDIKIRIASISKTFLAVVVLQLMEEGAFILDDKFSTFLPDSVTALFPYGFEITIYQLLSHTSGMYDFEDMQFIGMLLENTQYHWTPWELLVHTSTADSAVFFPPDTKYHYSNSNYILLGLIVEAVTGNSMESNIRSRVLDPLNLKNTYSWGEEIPQTNYSVGYMTIPGGPTIPITDQTLPMWFEWAHGQMVSNVEDLYLFFDALSKNELFQNQSTLDTMLAWSALSDYSYGLGISRWNFVLGYGHDGATLGFSSFATIDPQTGAVIIFGTNDFSGQLTIGEILLPIAGIIK